MRHLITVIFTLFLLGDNFAQTESCVDVRYIEAVQYISHNDSIKSFIKNRLSKKANFFKVKDILIKSNCYSYWRDILKDNISKMELRNIDSLNSDNTIIKGLSFLSIDTNSEYRLEFSEIRNNILYAHLTNHIRYKQYNNGVIGVSGGKYLTFLFLFNENGLIKKVYFGILNTETF